MSQIKELVKFCKPPLFLCWLLFLKKGTLGLFSLHIFCMWWWHDRGHVKVATVLCISSTAFSSVSNVLPCSLPLPGSLMFYDVAPLIILFFGHFEVKVYWLILNLYPDTKYYSLSGMWNHVFMRIFSVMFLSSVFLLQDVRLWCRYFFPELWGPVLSCTPRRREKDGWYQDDLLEIGDLNEMFSSSFVI